MKHISHFAFAAALIASSSAFAFDLGSLATNALVRRVADETKSYQRAAREGNANTISIPASGSLEVGFSPNGGGEALVLKVIRSAGTSLRVLSYSFTSAPVTQALLDAKRRGVDVQLVADWKSNASEDPSGKARAALSALVNAGIDARTIKAYPIHHDKVIIADGQSVELGSFNYSESAARRNSENVLVNWNNPQLAKVYLEHFERNYRQSQPYTPRY